MRRRWKVLVAVGAVALFAGILLLLPPRDDGLGWVRKYGGQEYQSPLYYYSSNRRDGTAVEFHFSKIPEELKIEIQHRQAGLLSRRLDRPPIIVDESRNLVKFYVLHKGSWLESQISAIRRALGIRSEQDQVVRRQQPM